MQVNKTWIAAVVLYILGIAGKKLGMEFTEETANQITDIILTVVLPLMMAVLSRRKGNSNEKRPTDTGSAV